MIRPTGPRVVGVLLAVALVSYTFVVAPRLAVFAGARDASVTVQPPAVRPTVSTPRGLFPPAGHDFIGVTTSQGTFDFGPVDAFTKAANHQPSVMMFSQGWAIQGFDRKAFDQVAQRGMMPLLSWEPWNFRDDSVSKDGTHAIQPAYQLSRIIAGNYDSYIRSYAEGVKSLNYDVGIRLAHEMNGFWYPWGTNINGNQPGEYVKMWRHVHDIFTSVGATNVTWVWSPNVNFDNKTRLAPLYPGDGYVDWLGLSGYYGTTGTLNYRSPDTIFNATIKELRGFTKKPIVITETAATESAGLKVRWIQDFSKYLPKHPEIIGFIWYEAIRETDWRIVSSTTASDAFAKLAADSRYSATWSVDMLPRPTVDTPSAGPSSHPGNRSPSPTPTQTNSTR